MPTPFQIEVANSTAHRPIRDVISGMVFSTPALLAELMEMALDTSNKNHHKACWSLELVLERHIDWLAPYLDTFCNTLTGYKHEGAIRSVSKICLFTVGHNQKHPGFLNGRHLQHITEACFDWLIAPNDKVATKAYAMRALYILGKNEDWVHPELQRILSEDFVKHTAAYKAAAKEVLLKLQSSNITK
ncbi:hypothetical protein AM493_10900 [Flavobacterium akiainvivens]|uniref:Adenylosuccinate lyase n=1 Tax=Flavobacterium akiainvivens TaxID=1202724 RepID=A0A0M9VIB6_9FLAO|nr:hypothetical protein [Flavobacterium akiainvivens]KOS06486.1 hypothetical protein AM493_10900 [Flavobacterium akiainvivens]SFQ12365.1 hypothetical protein SAMN05444144_101180 [Flavobacterium akiainvivens]